MPAVALTIAEQLTLLYLRDREGTAESGWLPLAASAGALAELALSDRLSIEPGKRKLVTLERSERTGDPALDTFISELKKAPRRASVARWLHRGAFRKLEHRVARGLCRRGILRMDEKRILLLFKREVFPEADPRPERALKAMLRRAIFSDEERVDDRTAVLISVGYHLGLLEILFDRGELGRRAVRILSILEGSGPDSLPAVMVDAVAQASSSFFAPVIYSDDPAGG